MKNKRLIDFIIFMPFAFSIGAFVIYIRYLLKIKSTTNLEVVALLESSIVRYRNIAIFSLAIGVILLFIKTLYEFLTFDNKTEYVYEENALDRISSRRTTLNKVKAFDETQIINDLLKDKILRVKFIDSNIKEKLVKFSYYNEKEEYLELIDIEENKKDKKEVIPETRKRDYILGKLRERDFIKCKKCKNIIASDAIMCVHCGTMLKNEKVVTKEKVVIKEQSTFNPVRFVLNLIVILLCIILVLLFVNKISRQNDINKKNLNIKTVDIN
ncbi:MAG: hypothetical protein IKF37_00565 [Bacilli bacterium]|nr:hypothetical protein [Bacilli bacterium]MBR2997553.1 hypothetical protein [Bacilli bacterium]